MPGDVLGRRNADREEGWHVNVTAPLRLIRAALPRMIATGGGAVVDASSAASSVTGLAAHGTSKAGLIAFTKAAAREWSGDGIGGNAFRAGTIATPAPFFWRHAMAWPGRPGAMAEAAVVASDAAVFMTGQLPVIDGEQTA